MYDLQTLVRILSMKNILSEKCMLIKEHFSAVFVWLVVSIINFSFIERILGWKGKH
jgi:hypothetical protein